MIPILLTVFLGCGSAEPPPEVTEAASSTRERPDITIVLAPGLRADIPGQRGAELSFLAGIGRTPSHRYGAAYAQSSSPFTSLGSLLTGLYVGAIPMCSLPRGATREEVLNDRPWCASIPEQRHSLPEVLALYGYHTALVTTGYPAADAFAGEFQVVKHLDDSSDLPAAALEAWGTVGPRLLVVVAADLRFATRADAGKVLAGLTDHSIPPGVPADVEQRAVEAYATEAGNLGKTVGKLLTDLEATAGSRGLVSVVGGLTGLNLAEQGGSKDPFVPMLVEDFILDRTIHVPLFLFEPGATTTTIHDDPVELIDIFPTVAKLADVRPPAGLSGADLRTAPTELGSGTGYAELGDQLALRQGTGFLLFRCYVHFCTSLDPQVTQRLSETDLSALDAGPFALYDVVWDPTQRSPSQDVTRARMMRAAMLRLRTGPAAVPADAVDAQRLWSIRMVRSQGYW